LTVDVVEVKVEVIEIEFCFYIVWKSHPLLETWEFFELSSGSVHAERNSEKILAPKSSFLNIKDPPLYVLNIPKYLGYHHS
jgi:hypothetical protein